MSVKNKKPKKDAPKREAADGRKQLWERILDIMADIPEEELAKLPEDLSERHEYYLYGTDD